MPTPEPVLMWSASVILAAVALVIVVTALWFTAAALHGYLLRYRVRRLTRAQIGACRDLAAQFRMENGTTSGPVSPPVDPIRIPKGHPEAKEIADV